MPSVEATTAVSQSEKSGQRSFKYNDAHSDKELREGKCSDQLLRLHVYERSSLEVRNSSFKDVDVCKGSNPAGQKAKCLSEKIVILNHPKKNVWKKLFQLFFLCALPQQSVFFQHEQREFIHYGRWKPGSGSLDSSLLLLSGDGRKMKVVLVIRPLLHHRSPQTL